MTVDFKYLPEFERRAKILAKKYKSFVKDYDEFLDSLEENPFFLFLTRVKWKMFLMLI